MRLRRELRGLRPVIGRLKNPPTPQEERRHMSALAALPREGEMRNTLEMCINGETPCQDGPYLVAGCLMNRYIGSLVWKLVKSEWDEMLEAGPDNSIVRMVGGVQALSKPNEAADVKVYFETHSVPTGRLTLEQHLERLDVNVASRQREKGLLTEWLLGEN